MNKIKELKNLGQSIWLDFINRSFIESGDLQKLVDSGVSGVTSNPTIFEKSINYTSDYDQQIMVEVVKHQSASDIFTMLAVKDIQLAADVLIPVYQETYGLDGYVSLEVNPLLANDSAATLHEASRLWEIVDRQNLMIKIPATQAGIPAITSAIAKGMNVNVTLIFSTQRYQEVINAYFSGLEERFKTGQSINHVHSVASFFVSRMDSKIDNLLTKLDPSYTDISPQELMGKSAVANAKLAYQIFKTEFSSSRFSKLKENGGNIQRPLWASTSTKNPNYSDILYVQELIAPNSVNTMPQDTLEKFIHHGHARISIEDNIEDASNIMNNLQNLGIYLTSVTKDLEDEGVESFGNSYLTLMGSLEKKMLVVNKS
jgi:transaldolase